MGSDHRDWPQLATIRAERSHDGTAEAVPSAPEQPMTIVQHVFQREKFRRQERAHRMTRALPVAPNRRGYRLRQFDARLEGVRVPSAPRLAKNETSRRRPGRSRARAA